MTLPWRFQTPCLPDNRSVAARRLQALERRFLSAPALFEKYKDTNNQPIAKRHARKVLTPNDPPPGKLWYLPHHPVFHPQKPSKVRVVFDCAARFRETSLNDQLLQGPDLTNNMEFFCISGKSLLRWWQMWNKCFTSSELSPKTATLCVFFGGRAAILQRELSITRCWCTCLEPHHLVAAPAWLLRAQPMTTRPSWMS